MIWLQSSGSVVSASVVEPTTSAKIAVTGLRSPVSFEARIFRASGSGVEAAMRSKRDASEGVSAIPLGIVSRLGARHSLFLFLLAEPDLGAG